MLISEVCKATNLTKKAIEYYIEEKLVFPIILENGYRDFSQEDIEGLSKIAILRKLGLSVEEIKAVLADKTNETLQRLSIQKELEIEREQTKKVIFEKLCSCKGYSEIRGDLKALEDEETVTEKFLGAFPGYYGRFVCLHFARFLSEPLVSNEQKLAYKEIINFLDSVPMLNIPDDLQAFLIESTKHIGTKDIKELIENTKNSIENPEEFIVENKEAFEQYLAFKKSDEYKASPVYKFQALLKEFNETSGYYDVFIPAMKKLSSTYAEYHSQLELANEKLIEQYPEIAELKDKPSK